ncbi:MAG: MlaD family protein [Gammaproteobacteria bacterium]
MNSDANYTLVGMFVTILGIALIIVVLWLSGAHSKKVYQIYSVYMHEAVSGLQTQSAVKFNGVDVGNVKNIGLDRHDPQKVKLLLNIEEGTPINSSTVAILKAQGITGLAYIDLKNESSMAPPLRALPGKKYPQIKSAPSLFVELDSVMRNVATNIDELTTNINAFVNQTNIQAFNNSLKNIEKLSVALGQNSQSIEGSLKLANRLLYNTSLASEQLPQVISQVSATLNNVNDASQQIKVSVRESRSALQGVNQQAIPNTVQALTHLNRVLINIEQLSAELKQNPSVLVRGKQAPPPGPGE